MPGRFWEGNMFLAAAALLTILAAAAPGSVLGADAPRGPAAPTIYFPERNDGQHRKPEDVGMDSARLDLASIKTPENR